jgi:D-lactate dehydrogenase
MPTPSIVFIDVVPDDAPLVTARFPRAAIFPGAELEGDVLTAARDAEVLSIFVNTPITTAILAKLPNLKLLCTRSVGFNHIDLDACRARGIVVCHVPDYGSHVIAEHVFALLLSTLRNIPQANARVQSGEFDYHGLRGMSLKGKTIGIVGTGRIGRGVAAIAHGFGMHILAVDVCRVPAIQETLGVQYVEMHELLAQSDVISLHVPESPDTHHMIDAKAFAAMKNGVVLVNTARGELIDSGALLNALESGNIRYALLDVLEHEHNFTENARLIKHPRVVATPHIAFYADDSMRNMYVDCFESIMQWTDGKTPDHVVKPVVQVCDLPGVKKN